MVSRRELLLDSAASGVAFAALAKPVAASVAPCDSPVGLRTYLRNVMRKQMIPGMQIAVIHRGKTVFLETFGLADIEFQVPGSNATVFGIASCTKAFVGVAVVQLVERGKLDLDAPISRYLEDLPVPWRAVTLGQIASHTSGIPDITSDLAELRLLVDGDPQASWEKVETLPMQFTPGEKFNYVQTNYVLLGKIIDAVTGEPFSRFIQQHQFDVAEMPRTLWGDDRDVVQHRARTYTPYVQVDGKPTRTNTLYNTYIVFPPMLRTCGGLNTTAEELARWIIALQQRRLLNKSGVTTLQTPRLLNDGKPGPWGIGGWALSGKEHPVYFSVGAAKAAFAIYLKDDLAVVALTNLSADLGRSFVDNIAAFYIEGVATTK